MVQHHNVLHSMAQHSTAQHDAAQQLSLPKQASLLALQLLVSAHCQTVLCYPISGSYQVCMACVNRCEAAGATVKDGGDPKPSEFNLSETWQASSKLQQLCAEGLGRSTADLVKSRQSQGVLAGRLM